MLVLKTSIFGYLIQHSERNMKRWFLRIAFAGLSSTHTHTHTHTHSALARPWLGSRSALDRLRLGSTLDRPRLDDDNDDDDDDDDTEETEPVTLAFAGQV